MSRSPQQSTHGTWSLRKAVSIDGGGFELTNTGPMLFRNTMEPTGKEIQVEPALAQSEMEPTVVTGVCMDLEP